MPASADLHPRLARVLDDLHAAIDAMEPSRYRAMAATELERIEIWLPMLGARRRQVGKVIDAAGPNLIAQLRAAVQAYSRSDVCDRCLVLATEFAVWMERGGGRAVRPVMAKVAQEAAPREAAKPTRSLASKPGPRALIDPTKMTVTLLRSRLDGLPSLEGASRDAHKARVAKLEIIRDLEAEGSSRTTALEAIDEALAQAIDALSDLDDG